MKLTEIQKILKSKAKNRTRVNGVEFIPTAKKVSIDFNQGVSCYY